MFAEVFRFELRYQLARKSTWFYFLLLNALILRLSAESFFDGARANGYPYNAPFVLASAGIIAGIFGMVMSAAIAGDAAARDVHLRMAPLMYTSPVGRAAYLGGRFLAVFVLVAVLMASIPLGQLLLLWLPGLDPALVAPFEPARYLLVYASLMVPTVFVTTALMFAAALLARRAMAAFAVAAGLFVSAIFTNAVLAQTKNLWALARMLDPFALTVMSELSRQRTVLQKGQMLIGLEPTVLANRGLWIAIGCVALLGAYARFSFSHDGAARRPRWWPRGWVGRGRGVADPLEAAGPAVPRAALAPLPPSRPRFDARARLRQVLAITATSFREIVFARGFLVVVAVAGPVALTGPELMEHLGVPLVPVTGMIAMALGNATDFFGFVAPLICVFYAGELVWRERDAGLGPIADAAPIKDWVPLLGKGLGLALALATWQGLLMAAGIFTQWRMEHFDFQPLLWVQMLFGLGLSGHLLFAVVAIALHVLVNQKFAGHLAGIAAFGLMLFSSQLGIEHTLLIYSADPGWNYSDMRGYGGTLGPVLWFKLYWAGWALLLASGARLLWVRGAEHGVAQRWAQARARVSRPLAATAALAMLLVLGAGGYIFYNTNVLNTYANSKQREARRVAYERRYAAVAALPQPLLASRTLRVELYPDRAEATITGRDVLVNRSERPIDTLHVETAAEVVAGPLRFDRDTTLVADDAELRHRTVKLRRPLQPGESLAMDYDLRFGGRGFGNGGIHTAITAGASHFERDWLPTLGYQRDREITDAAARREHGLPPRPPITPLADLAARHDPRGNQRIRVDTTIGTAADQVAVAPGQLQRSWSEGGRRYFRYVTPEPIENGFGIYSARYAIHETRWRDVAIRIYHHPAHAANVARIAQGVKASLERYTRTIGPYPARQLTVVEAAGYNVSARSHPTSIRMFEGYALMNPDADWRKVDFAFAVMAHEIAHQWWGNQLTPANVAGAPFVSESLAWYSALGVVADAKGEAHLERFLDVMREDYLGPRARDGVPLLEASDWFTAYRLGPFSMVALRDAIGEERVNLALRRFFAKHGHGQVPLATSLDLYAELKAVTPAAQHELLADLFERNTFWNLQAKEATSRKVGKAWEVTLVVGAEKVAVDRQGRVAQRPLREPVEIGVYGPGTDDAPGKLLYLARHRLKEGEQRITVSVPSEPARAGIDPRNVLIDTHRANNMKVLTATP